MFFVNQNDTSLLLKAIDFSARKHSTQRRKDVAATPYINHPIEVAQVLSAAGRSRCAHAHCRDSARHG